MSDENNRPIIVYQGPRKNSFQSCMGCFGLGLVVLFGIYASKPGLRTAANPEPEATSTFPTALSRDTDAPIPEPQNAAPAQDISDTPTSVDANDPEFIADGERSVREYDANEVADALDGTPEEKNRARKAKFNNSVYLQEYEGPMGAWVAGKEYSRAAVKCGIRDRHWRDTLLSMWNMQILADNKFRWAKMHLTPDERLAAKADESIHAKWINGSMPDCEDLREMPLLKTYDLIASGRGSIPRIEGN